MMSEASHKVEAGEPGDCVHKMELFLEAALAEAEVPTFGRKEPARVIRMRHTGARPAKTQVQVPVIVLLPGVSEILTLPTEIRELLRELFYTYAVSGSTLAASSAPVPHTISRGGFLIFSKQAGLLTKHFGSPAIDAVYTAAVGTRDSAEGEQVPETQHHQAGFSQFCTAVQAIAAHQQQSDECTPEILQAFAEQYLRPLLSQKHAGELPEPCLLMWKDAYVDVCISSFRARLQPPFKYYARAARGTQEHLIDRGAVLGMLKDFGFFPRILRSQDAEVSYDVVLAAYALRCSAHCSCTTDSPAMPESTPDAAPDARERLGSRSVRSRSFRSFKQQATMKERSSPVCQGPTTCLPSSSGLTFEQFVDVMILCAVAAFGNVQVDTRAHVVFDGEFSVQAKALWTNKCEEAEVDRARLVKTMRAWSAALRPRYTSEFKPSGLCWLPTAVLPQHVADGVPLQKRDYDRMVHQVGQRYLGELLEADRQLLAQGQRRVEIQQSHRQIQERRLTLQRRAGQVP